MKKKLVLHLVHGFSITVGVCAIIQFIIAQAMGSAVTPGFAARFSNSGAAALAQLILTGVIGMTFAGAALVFEEARWSYLKQGAVHFLITALVWLPIVFFCGWTPVTPVGVICTVGGWTLTYVINWTVQYFIYKKQVAQLNAKIQASRQERH